jgi:hypothetical protein
LFLNSAIGQQYTIAGFVGAALMVPPNGLGFSGGALLNRESGRADSSL